MKKSIIFIILLFNIFTTYITAQNVVVIIIDGARYSETFGDPSRTYIPKMDSLATYGTYIDSFYNDSLTYTSRALPALWTGAWTAVHDTFYNGGSTQYTDVPSIFEYYRKDANASANQCYYILKYVSSLWLPSFHPQYGPNYWPTFHSVGNLDVEVYNEAISIMNTYHPQHTWIYFANVDSRGHSGVWNDYTNAIEIADSLVGEIWQFIQNDPVYQNNTYLFVTNDHGRHDDAHGGFQSHGDGCEGCRHIMFFAMGPAVKQNHVSNTVRNIPDLSVTIANILNISAPYATGDYMSELFNPNQIELPDKPLPKAFALLGNYPNPFNPVTTISFVVPTRSYVEITIYNSLGEMVKTIFSNSLAGGEHEIVWNGRNERGQQVSSGIYFYNFKAIALDGGKTFVKNRKMILMQ